jgi:creatinine amidohydrolase
MLIAWWDLLAVDPEFFPKWRESKFPGGIAHACELETSMCLYLAEEDVRKDKIKDHVSTLNDGNPYIWGDLFARGPAALVSWTSSYTPRGVIGEPEWASREKGQRAYEEAVKQLCNIVDFFRDRPADVRRRHQLDPPSMPMPWGQLE